jgi:hypothetical protein
MTLKPANYKYYPIEDTSLQKIGPLYADIELLSFHDLVLNRRGHLPDKDIRRIKKSALVNSDAAHLVINEEIKELLGLEVCEKRTVRLPDQSVKEVEMVGPVEIRLEGQNGIARAMVLPGANEVLLGRIPLAGLHVFIDSESRQLRLMSSIPIKKAA